jgi:tetratricopeptide (TPR) repeat protein
MNKTADPRYTQAVQAYEQALKSMQSQKFERAKTFFEKVIATGPKELVDRALVHLSICNNQLSRTQTNFKTVDEHYDYAVSLMNMGDYVGAREHLEEISRKAPNLDFVWYGLAVLDCLTGRAQESLQHLAESIRLNPHNRLQARNDSDFRNMADDPRFTELIYPEGTTA